MQSVNGVGGGKVEFVVCRVFVAMSSDFHKAESGTELLARLEGRSSLKEIEPNLFADEDSPEHELECCQEMLTVCFRLL
ncbi:DNA repair protein XRCC2 isoform X2 [Lemur catta]|uniref:DNA repair protein XRCC2 isoform X2 n=1 Tax=Lemur catta TaxID=9447 RepID=UPI001E2694E7|nr:DNA repair protein XRCC2 isoform X2 [Lemur catta]